jgi:hypothetical protein
MRSAAYTEYEVRLYEELFEHISAMIRRVWPQALVILKNVSFYSMNAPTIEVTIPRGRTQVGVSSALPQAMVIRDALGYSKENHSRNLAMMIIKELMTNEELFEHKLETSFYSLSLRRVSQAVKNRTIASAWEAAEILAVVFDKNRVEIEEDLVRMERRNACGQSK